MATYGTFVDGVSLKASEANDFLVWTTFGASTRFKQNTNQILSLSYLKYARVNKLVFVNAHGVFSSSGGAGSAIEFVLPVTAADGSQKVLGSAYIEDDSANDVLRLVPVITSTTVVKFLADDSTSLSTYLGEVGGPTFTIANGDSISLNIVYEAA